MYDDLDPELQEIHFLMDCGRVTDAAGRLMTAMADERRGRPRYLAALARLRILDGRYDEAATLLELAEASEPCDSRVRLERALLLHRRGERTAARRMIDEVLEREPGHADAWARLGCLAADSGDDEGALEIFDHVLRIDPDHFKANRGLGLLLQRNDHGDEAVPYLERAAAHPAMPTHCHALLAEIWLQREDADKVISHAFEELRRDSGNVRCRVLAAAALLDSGRPGEALSVIEPGLAEEPESLPCTRLVANALRDLRRWDEAIGAYQRSIDMGSNDLTTHLSLASCQAQAGHERDAVDTLHLASRLEFDDLGSTEEIAWLCRDLGCDDLALDCWRRRTTAAPDEAESWIERAYAAMRLAWRREARRAWKRAVTLEAGAIMEYLTRVGDLVACGETEYAREIVDLANRLNELVGLPERYLLHPGSGRLETGTSKLGPQRLDNGMVDKPRENGDPPAS